MLFKLPVVLAALGLAGLSAATPIADGGYAPVIIKRAGGGGNYSDGGSHGGGAGGGGSGNNTSGGGGSGGSSDGGSHGGGSGGGSGGGGGGGSDGAPGPSGQLLRPQGGDTIYTEVDWPGAGFNFVYKPVYQRNPDPNCVNQRQACYAATSWLSVSLVGITTPGVEYSLAEFLHVNLDDPSANINVWLGVPEEADCGDFRVRVIEHQRYYNRWVQFQSAAPMVRMGCVRYAGPGE